MMLQHLVCSLQSFIAFFLFCSSVSCSQPMLSATTLAILTHAKKLRTRNLKVESKALFIRYCDTNVCGHYKSWFYAHKLPQEIFKVGNGIPLIRGQLTKMKLVPLFFYIFDIWGILCSSSRMCYFYLLLWFVFEFFYCNIIKFKLLIYYQYLLLYFEIN